MGAQRVWPHKVSDKRHLGAWNAKCPISLGNFTPKTSNYCLKNGALAFPGVEFI